MVFDVDSTLTRLEGIEWLAEQRGPAVARAVADMTTRVMEGALALDAVYAERLAMVRPSRADLTALGEAYAAAVVAGVPEVFDALRASKVHIVLVSGGLLDAVVPFAVSLGVPATDVHAVPLEFTADGAYAGFDATSPLACRGGKPRVVESLHLPRPILAIGDGSTDAELKSCVDAFAAFTGVARREAVVAVADHVVTRFADIPSLVL